MISPRTLLEHPWPAPSLCGDNLWQALDRHLGFWLRGAMGADECQRYVRGVYEGRERWNSDFEGEQFSLGRAWYTHLEQGKSHEYFAHARASDRDVERFAPGLQGRVRQLLAELLGAEVKQRRGWCGPGVHVFPAGEWVAREGGVIHADIEGLTEAHVAARARALTVVLMLQPPDRGGGLRLWDKFHHRPDALDPEALEGVQSEVVPYGVGDLAVLDSYRLHQIEPFDGVTDRLSVTAHTACLAPNLWEVWFLHGTGDVPLAPATPALAWTHPLECPMASRTSFSPRDLVSLPHLSPSQTLTLLRELEARAASSPSLPPPVHEALGELREARRRLRNEAGVRRPSHPIDLQEARNADRRLDAAWGAAALWAGSWLKLEGAHHPDPEGSQRLFSALFGEGLRFLTLAYKAEWAESEARLRAIDELGLEPVFERLGGLPFLEAIRAAHRAYGRALQLSSPPPSLPHNDRARQAHEEALDALRYYVTQVSACSLRRHPGAAQLADALLRPLMDWEPPEPAAPDSNPRIPPSTISVQKLA